MNSPFHNRRIGILGGSFNPAHAGHLRISLHALRALDLDEIWWLVSPQNPLKSADNMAPLQARMQSARNAAKNARIRVRALESQFGTQYTVDTLQALRQKFPRARFVWIMGSDNLENFHGWKDWEKITALIPIAVLHRDPPGINSLQSVAAKKMAGSRLSSRLRNSLALEKPPAWIYIKDIAAAHSSTAIRAKKPQKWWF